MRGFYAPLEAALHGHAGLASALPDLPRRRKLGLLDADLRDLGEGPAPAAPVAAVPALTTTARALGAAYVVEGATLGGAGISRHVRATLPDPAPGACRFFAPYGTSTGPMWRRFQAALAEHEARGGDRDAVLAAADETFTTLEAWLEREGVLR